MLGKVNKNTDFNHILFHDHITAGKTFTDDDPTINRHLWSLPPFLGG
jgi:hypothetical protein